MAEWGCHLTGCRLTGCHLTGLPRLPACRRVALFAESAKTLIYFFLTRHLPCSLCLCVVLSLSLSSLCLCVCGAIGRLVSSAALQGPGSAPLVALCLVPFVVPLWLDYKTQMCPTCCKYTWVAIPSQSSSSIDEEGVDRA